MKDIKAEIDINVPVDVIWEILTDVQKYPEWNPFTPIVETNFKLNSIVYLEVAMNKRQPRLLVQDKLFVFDPEKKEICWGANRKGGPRILTSNRWQILEEISANKTRYVTSENPKGILGPLVRMMYQRDIKRGFEDVCKALKTRAEA